MRSYHKGNSAGQISGSICGKPGFSDYVEHLVAAEDRKNVVKLHLEGEGMTNAEIFDHVPMSMTMQEIQNTISDHHALIASLMS